jgi:hypothetical protein
MIFVVLGVQSVGWALQGSGQYVNLPRMHLQLPASLS